MKSQCLPFSQIPHTTRLFTDFLSYSQNVRPFYPRSPHFKDWLKEEASSLHFDSTRRELVTAILERQNRGWGASPETLGHVARLRDGALAVVTGQQVGLFGGPVFSLFKALSAVRLATEATAAGVDCVPMFWLATEDHDLAEVNHISLPGPDGTLQKLSTPTHGVADARVGALKFGPEIESVVEAAVEWLGDSDASRLLRECYRTGETMGGAFARLFARLFADWGVILLDAADPDLHRVAEPVYRAGIERATELADLLLARGEALDAAGYHQQVKVNASSTLLFAERNGSRVPVHRRGERRCGSRICHWRRDRCSGGVAPADRRGTASVQPQCDAAARGAGLPAAHPGLHRRGGRSRLLRPSRRGVPGAARAGHAYRPTILRHDYRS